MNSLPGRNINYIPAILYKINMPADLGNGIGDLELGWIQLNG